MLLKMWRKGNLCTLLVGKQIGAATLENSMEVSQKTKFRSTIGPSNFTPGYISKKTKNTNPKTHMHSNVHSSIIYNCQDMKATLVSSNRWMDKEDVVYIYNGILVSHKKEWNSAICSNMGGPRGHYTKWNKSERVRQTQYGIIYMWDLKYTRD